MKGIELRKIDNLLILVFTISEYSPKDWIHEELTKHGRVTIKKTFHFNDSDKYQIKYNEDDYEYPPKGFILGIKVDEYYKLSRKVLETSNTFYIHSDIDIKSKHLIAETKISILRIIDKLVKEDVHIGGSKENNIPFEVYNNMVDNFPTSYEKKIYSEARISSTIKNYFDSTSDSEYKLQKYLNKKKSTKGTNLLKTFKEYEFEKYTTIHDKIEHMLATENSYNENQWQDEILEIILLLYPKYIFASKNVFLKIDKNKRRFLDFILVDSNGHVDVIEIKKPFHKSIMSGAEYRGNYPPHKDLTGTIMQLEKYLFHFNRYGSRGEEDLTNKFKQHLPTGLKISITNPKGFVIMGRDNNLNKEQKSDFEIIKRKYKNVIDIITYDDLLRRLKFTIEQIQKI